MALITTNVQAPKVRLVTDDDRLVIIRRRGDLVHVHIESLYDDTHEIQAMLRPDQVERLLEALK